MTSPHAKTLAVAPFLAATILLLPSVARAQDTACYIYVQGDCHGWVPSSTWFTDPDPASASDNGHCLHRAREFVQWCGLGSAGDQVYAAFNLDAVTVSAQIFRAGFDVWSVDPTVSTYGMGWTPITPTPNEAIVLGLPPVPGDIWRMTP